MKKTISAIAISLALGLSAARANEGTPVNAWISSSFQKDFSNAKNVSWQNKGSYSIANFTWNNQVLFAYYLENGHLNTVVRNMLSENLPIVLLADIKNNYAGYWITDLYESVTNGHTSYTLTLENADQRLQLKSNAAGEWNVMKTINKNIL